MNFDLGAFAAGFATTAVESEKESAKIGRELLKEALEDFRAEAKAYKEEVDRDTKEYTELANILTPLLKDPNKVTAVLDRGKGFAKLFIQKSDQVAKDKGYDSVADLVRVSDSFEGTIDPIDWINSGAPIDASAPTYVGPKEVRTSVFGREIEYGDSQKESIESAYIRGDSKQAVTAPMAEIDISAPTDETKLRFDAPSRTDVAGMTSQVANALSQAAGLTAEYYVDNSGALRNRLSGEATAGDMRVLRDATEYVKSFVSGFKDQDKAIDYLDLVPGAIGVASATYDPTDDPFYRNAPKMSSVARTGGGGTPANPASVISNQQQSSQQAPQQQQPQQQPPATNPANHPQIKAQINNMGSPTRGRRSVVKGILVSVYGMSPADAQKEAERLIP